MFLRSDGTWAEVVTESIETDNVTLENVDGVLSIVGFKNAPEGAQPIKNQDGSLNWVKPDSTAVETLQEDVENIKQILNSTDGLISDVEDLKESVGKAAEYDEEGNLIAAATGLHAELDQKANAEEVQAALDLKANAAEVEEALDLKANVSDVNDALNLKANATEMEEALGLKANVADVYTKNDTDNAIAAAIANVDHLSREIVDILPDIEDANPNIIYMTPSGLQEDDNKYYEWILINGVFEQVGSWEVDLRAYATKENLQDLNDIVEEKADIVYYTIVNKETGETMEVPGEFLSPEDREKLAALVIDKDGNVGMSGSVNADNVEGLGTWLTKNGSTYITNLSENNLSKEITDKLNFITSVDKNNFSVINGELKITKIDQSQVNGLEDILASKATLGELNAVIANVSELDKILNGYTEDGNEVPGLTEQFFKLNNKVGLLEQNHDNFITITTFNSTVNDLNTLIEANKDNIETLTDSVNELDKHLTWQDLK